MALLVKEYRTLNSGERIPVLGLGVFKVDNETTSAVVADAIKAGIRLIDTAKAYGNEEGVGRGIKNSGVDRKDLFVTTKVWNSDHGYDNTIAAVKESLQKLAIAYLDLVLIHWPVPKMDRYVETYQALEYLQKEGLVRSIGVSNFKVPHLEKLLKECEVVPAVNQIEVHPYLIQTETIEFCKLHHIAVQAWSPLAKGEALTDPVILEIAATHKKTAAQVVLRWDYQKEVLSIPKSVKTERTVANADIFDFSLSSMEMAAIDALDCGKRTGPDPDVFDRMSR